MMPPGPPPAYDSSVEPITASEETSIKHPYNFQFSEESIRKGLLSACQDKHITMHTHITIEIGSIYK